ncbi:hypothetical protein OH77DRAFT_276999 [Trametes cingulata]|nr:hypothetical protein OH77DRAFT_276999 [Trametes cingulata]
MPTTLNQPQGGPHQRRLGWGDRARAPTTALHVFHPSPRAVPLRRRYPLPRPSLHRRSSPLDLPANLGSKSQTPMALPSGPTSPSLSSSQQDPSEITRPTGHAHIPPSTLERCRHLQYFEKINNEEYIQMLMDPSPWIASRLIAPRTI